MSAPSKDHDPATPPADTVVAQHAVAPTEVLLTWIALQREHWIRFGAAAAERFIDRRRRVLSFAPGALFAVVRWEANAYGTILSHIAIAQAPTSGEAFTALPCVTPGAVVLLDQKGWPRVRRVLGLIDRVEALGVGAADAALDYWRHVHNRLAGGATPRPYSAERHATWLKRRELAP